MMNIAFFMCRIGGIANDQLDLWIAFNAWSTTLQELLYTRGKMAKLVLRFLMKDANLADFSAVNRAHIEMKYPVEWPG